MVVIVPIGFLVEVGEIPGHTHFLYYSEDRLTALVDIQLSIVTMNELSLSLLLQMLAELQVIIHLVIHSTCCYYTNGNICV